MSKKRKFTSEQKVKIVIELLKEEKTLGELASELNVNPNQLSRWRKEFLEKASGVFDTNKEEKAHIKAEKEMREEKDRLLKAIGQLTMERDYLQAAQAKNGNNRRLL